MLIENTPIESYQASGHTVYVKRDDLYGHYPAPPLAKLRGASVLLRRLKSDGIKKVGVFDTRVSKAGQGIAYLCRELELECLLGFPMLKSSEPSESQKIAEQLEARLCPLKAGRTNPLYFGFKRFVEEQKGYMLPLGLVCRETVEALKRQSASLEIKVNSIVLCTGTGTIATGVALGTQARVYGVSCGMATTKQWERIHRLAYPELICNLLLIPPWYSYYTPVHNNCPFPTSPYYDAKAWEWLVENIDKLEEPILFWNIGV